MTPPIAPYADISDSTSEASIEVEEGKSETIRQKSANRALAGSARADQSNIHARHGSMLATTMPTAIVGTCATTSASGFMSLVGP